MSHGTEAHSLFGRLSMQKIRHHALVLKTCAIICCTADGQLADVENVSAELHMEDYDTDVNTVSLIYA